jgi:polar amino acid transport system permease protein
MAQFMTPFVVALLGLGLNEGAYMAEIVRAGILAVDRGQVDAALALGMSRRLALRRIILPQALRVIVPPAGNQFISLLKATSLVSVIAGGDLLTAAENISSANLRTVELMLVATFWYLVLTTVTSLGQYLLERRLARDGTGLRAP